jgi:hypothetical protein
MRPTDAGDAGTHDQDIEMLGTLRALIHRESLAPAGRGL